MRWKELQKVYILKVVELCIEKEVGVVDGLRVVMEVVAGSSCAESKEVGNWIFF